MKVIGLGGDICVFPPVVKCCKHVTFTFSWLEGLIQRERKKKLVKLQMNTISLDLWFWTKIFYIYIWNVFQSATVSIDDCDTALATKYGPQLGSEWSCANISTQILERRYLKFHHSDWNSLVMLEKPAEFKVSKDNL